MSKKVAVLGAGSIGVSFAVLFASNKFQVNLWDISNDSLKRARQDIRQRLGELDAANINVEPLDSIESRIQFFDSAVDAVQDADLVQECIPEKLELKRELFQSLEADIGSDTVIASSSSAILASSMAEGLKTAYDQVIIAHPGNPPHLIPVIEIVPTEQTRRNIIDWALEIYWNAQLSPVELYKEIDGFVFNRLQGAVLREAYCLVRDGIISVEDLDTVMKDGLGRRWAFIGPFETVDLNTRGGIASHAEKMGPAYWLMGNQRGQDDPWNSELVAEVERQRRAILPLEGWEERVEWRNQKLLNFLTYFGNRDSDRNTPSES